LSARAIMLRRDSWVELWDLRWLNGLFERPGDGLNPSISRWVHIVSIPIVAWSARYNLITKSSCSICRSPVRL
jgi:hypothetical protein